MSEKKSAEVIELYRVMAAVCINVLSCSFEGLQEDDRKSIGSLFMDGDKDLRQLIEDVGGLWPYLLGQTHRYPGITPEYIGNNLKTIGDVLSKIASKYPSIIFNNEGFSANCNVFHLDPEGDYPSIKARGDFPDTKVWKSLLSPSEFKFYVTCVNQDGSWTRRLAPLVTIFGYARGHIMDYL
jgi:hypothetical protein